MKTQLNLNRRQFIQTAALTASGLATVGVAQPGPQTRKDAFGSPMPSAGVYSPPRAGVLHDWMAC